MAARAGAKHHNAKMTTAKVRAARKAYAVVDDTGRRKWTMAALARKYGVAHQTMHAVLSGRTWKDVV